MSSKLPLASDTLTSKQKKRLKEKKNSMMGNLNAIQRQIEADRHLMLKNSDKEYRNRYMMEVIDTIYKKEADYTEDNVKAIRKDIKSWANYQPYPSNVQARFIKRGREREAEEKKQEAETLLNVPIDLNEESSAQKI